MKKTKTVLLIFLGAAVILLGWQPDYSKASAKAFARDLYYGIYSNPDVVELQKFLQGQGIYSGPITGNYLELTREAVKRFQLREGIIPAKGYFGPITRKRVNEILSVGISTPLQTADRQQLIASLLAQIQELQRRLQRLEKQLAEQKVGEGSGITTLPSAIPTPPPGVVQAQMPNFVKEPQVVDTGFDLDFPYGVKNPYYVSFDWKLSQNDNIDLSIECAPEIIFKTAGTLATTTRFYPDASKDYRCIFTATNTLSGNSNKAEVEFSTPQWLSISGEGEVDFPRSALTSFKIGEGKVYNGTDEKVLFSQLKFLLKDGMNSSLNRGRKVYFILRNGTSTEDTIISRTAFTFNSNPPPQDGYNTSELNLSYPKTLKKGEIASFAIWLDGLDYVVGGRLELELKDIFVSTDISPVASISYVIEK